MDQKKTLIFDERFFLVMWLKSILNEFILIIIRFVLRDHFLLSYFSLFLCKIMKSKKGLI